MLLEDQDRLIMLSHTSKLSAHQHLSHCRARHHLWTLLVLPAGGSLQHARQALPPLPSACHYMLLTLLPQACSGPTRTGLSSFL